jgi:predicted DNA-binding protein YlxM (UPF0122 family)
MSRKVLTLEQRLEVVKHLENGKSLREIAQIMGVGRTQIQTINKRKAEILEDYGNNFHQTENENKNRK